MEMYAILDIYKTISLAWLPSLKSIHIEVWKL